MSLTAEKMREALGALDRLLPRPVSLIVGGGGAMILAHRFPLSTFDIDAVPKGLSSDELKPFIEEVARQANVPPDWLNPWFASFTHVLPEDFSERLIDVFQGERLTAQALGREDLLVMKCFAHRPKDVGHARALVRAGADVEFVRQRIESLAKKKIPGTAKAEAFLDEIVDLETP